MKQEGTAMKKGFTLVELLVVITILGILMAMMVPAAGLVLKRTKISNTRGDAGLVAAALMKYQAEYNRWPATYAPDAKDTTDPDWVNMMAPKPGTGPLDTNPKRVIFFEPGGGALNDSGAFVDAWGAAFKYRLDLDGDSQVDNAELDDPNYSLNNPVRVRVLAWSGGPDGKPETWDDNVKSWE